MEEQKIYDFPPKKNFGSYMKRFGRFIILGIIIIVIAIFALDSFYTIKEQEQAVITTFGKAKAVNTAGLHMKLPIIQRVQKVDTTIHGFAIGYNQETGESVDAESMMITNDFNFVNVDFFVEYKVSDPIKFLFASDAPGTILKNIAQSSIRMTVGSYNVDSVITTGKFEIQSKIRDSILKKLESQDIGIQLVNITIQDAEPPTSQVMEAFKSVETAKQSADTAVNNANKYQNEQLPKADAEVDKILQEAESTKAERINEANAEVAKFNKMYQEYAKYPLITKKRMFYETMEDILPSLKVVIDSKDSNVQQLLPLDKLMEGGTKE
ncbi:MAG TPA: FtsH protease activity modulator HflK [Clostridiales bacterium]|nr:FtsH protease activity modulator HflK [Clostridiales bacterium]